MKAWRVHDFGEPQDHFVLDEIPAPTATDLAGMGMSLGGWVPLPVGQEPFSDWVLLQMRAAALALPDVTMARGTYPVPVPRPYVSGQEGVGIVIDAAPAWQHLMGQRVVACCIQPWGSLAPVAVGVGLVVPVPESMSDSDAAGFVIAAHTAYHATIRRGQVRKGETVVVLGAAGGVGSAIVQICLAEGARVICAVGSEEKVAFCIGLGAEAVDYSVEGWVDEIRQRTDGRGVDAILDPVQGQLGAAARDLLVPDGRHMLCGHAGGLIPHDPQFYVYNRTLVGVDLGGYPSDVMREFHVETQAYLEQLISEGRYRPQVHRVVEFDEVPAAIADLAARRTTGRVVVRIPEEAAVA
jgi:NADPH:quinone reductase